MVKTVLNKVTTKSPIKKRNHQNDKNVKEQDYNKTSKNTGRNKNKSKIKDLTNNPNKPLELPQPSALLQIPLTGDAQNLFWVLPYSTDNKVIIKKKKKYIYIYKFIYKIKKKKKKKKKNFF